MLCIPNYYMKYHIFLMYQSRYCPSGTGVGRGKTTHSSTQVELLSCGLSVWQKYSDSGFLCCQSDEWDGPCVSHNTVSFWHGQGDHTCRFNSLGLSQGLITLFSFGGGTFDINKHKTIDCGQLICMCLWRDCHLIGKIENSQTDGGLPASE